MNEFEQMLISSYSSDELVAFFEIEPDELVEMIQAYAPDKFKDNMYKFTGFTDEQIQKTNKKCWKVCCLWAVHRLQRQE